MKLKLSSLVMIAMLSSLPHTASAGALLVCSAAHLRIAIEAEEVTLSHTSATLAIRNLGDDCLMPSSLPLSFYDRHGTLLPVISSAMASHKQVRVAGGHRVVFDMRWVSGPVYAPSREAQVASIKITIGSATLQLPFETTMFGPVSGGILVSLTRLRSVEGMASDIE